MTLGEIIKKLEKLPDDHSVWFEFGGLSPRMFLESYRGDYSETCLGFGEDTINVKTLREFLKSKIGDTIYGYKGGEYEVREDKEVWVANSSADYTRCYISKITHDDYSVYFKTKMKK